MLTISFYHNIIIYSIWWSSIEQQQVA
jgi:hypothetical protein